MRVGLGLVVVAACCPPAVLASKTEAHRETVVEVKTYAPLQFGSDARAPGNAVILGIDDRDRSLVVPLAARAASSDQTAAWTAGAWTAALAAARLLDKDVA